jgi:hypothetical protein
MIQLPYRDQRDGADTSVKDFTLDEFKKIMLEKSPVSLYHTMYSEKRPCYHITKPVMPTDGGVWVFADSAADKTPKLRSWESFYKELLYQGLEYIKF